MCLWRCAVVRLCGCAVVRCPRVRVCCTEEADGHRTRYCAHSKASSFTVIRPDMTVVPTGAKSPTPLSSLQLQRVQLLQAWASQQFQQQSILNPKYAKKLGAAARWQGSACCPVAVNPCLWCVWKQTLSACLSAVLSWTALCVLRRLMRRSNRA